MVFYFNFSLSPLLSIYTEKQWKLISLLLFLSPLLTHFFFFLTSLYHHTLNTHPHSHLHPIIGKNQHISSHNFLNLQPWQENISYHLIFVLNFPTCLGCLEGWREKKMLHSSFALRCLKSHHQPIIFTLLHF